MPLQARAFEVLAEPDTHSNPEARCELVPAWVSPPAPAAWSAAR